MKTIAIIPARLNSTRLPRKLLAKLGNKYIFQYVYENVSKVKNIAKTLIATDSEEIMDICYELGFNAILTPDYFQSGTDRIWYAYQLINESYDLILNVQADEPFISENLLSDFLNYLYMNMFDVGTIITPNLVITEISDPNVVKVVCDSNNYAMYFSRSPIPSIRDKDEFENAEISKLNIYYKHIGIYAYKPEALKIFAELPQSSLEKLEKLEQLRLLQNGSKYLCFQTNQELLSIDTAQDLVEAQKKFNFK
jgi:3-deoxy-manno-octulosonate cytidylyltransferase (CMP-KDO synthetase)